MLKALLVGTLLTMTAAATDYHVGPGQSMTQIGQVPWYALQPGDNVYIHYQPTPYYEKFLISSRGTPTQWIRVLGVPGPNGELPIISGNNATTSNNNHYYWQSATNMQWSGVVQVAVRADPVNGASPLPGYIEIANLQIQDGDQAYTFTAENGTKANYDVFASCIYARSVQHILIRNNVMTNCGLGFYNWTGSGSAYYDGLEVDTVLRGNYFYNNGVPNSYGEHQTYTESDGVTIEYNHYGPTRAGMLGSQLKDRSAGSVIRYNYIEASGGGWMLDLVEPENGWGALGSRATYAQDFVYGNVFNNKLHSQNTIHWNEDHYGGIGRATVPGGKLSFYANTMATVANASDMGHYFLVNPNWGAYDCPTVPLPAVIDVRNNIIAALPRTPGSAVPAMQLGYCGSENFSLGKNWMSPGWYTSGGTVAGAANMFVPAINDPGFVNLAGDDYHILPGSSPTGIGQALPGNIVTNATGMDQTPTQQYVYHTQVTARASRGGAGSDLGAFDSSAPTGCTYAVSPASNSFAAGASSGTFSVTTGTSCGWSASTTTTWLSITSGASGTGYGLVSYTVSANPTSASRSGNLTVAGSTIPVTQAGLPCSYSLSATSSSLAAASGGGSVNVTGVTGCSWTAVSNTAWIAISSGASGSGNGLVAYSVAANTATSARTGTVTIAGQTFTVTQAAAAPPCSYSISQTSASAAATGGSGSVTVTASTGCSWTGVSNASWITVTSGASGSGNGSVGYSVAANTSTSTRSGTVSIGGQTLTVSQAGIVPPPPSCSYSVSPTTVSVPVAGGRATLTVTAPAGCAWSVSSGASWITITSGASGTGNGSVVMNVASNSTTSRNSLATTSRSASVTAANNTITVTQDATSANPRTVSFRQGVSGYTGTLDRNISTMYIGYSWNNGIGVTDPNGTTIFIKNDTEFEARGLIRFTGLNVPAGATVISATLTITFANWWIDTPPVLTGYYLNTPWNGTAAQAGLNWKNRDTSTLWAVPGAKGMGSDLVANQSFTFAPIPLNGDMTQTVTLDPAVVQNWINNPASNQGVLLGLNSPTALGRIQAYPSEATKITNRPMLTITYR
jgi:hypothetical protein